MPDTKLRDALHEEVVIVSNQERAASGAQDAAPDHSPRGTSATGVLPARGIHAPGARAESQRRVEEFLYYQAELLDRKQWAAYIDLFDDRGMYWMPVTPEQTDWLDTPSIFIEDRLLMEVRRGRVTHPNAWSQAPEWGSCHLLGNVVIESETDTRLTVRSRFMVQELRRDQVRHFSGSYRHTLLKRGGGELSIELQRVDLLNAQAPFDYVLQVWL
jgi:3-phenylpropionate/cinnamic acid dioxygenase small subunit